VRGDLEGPEKSQAEDSPSGQVFPVQARGAEDLGVLQAAA